MRSSPDDPVGHDETRGVNMRVEQCVKENGTWSGSVDGPGAQLVLVFGPTTSLHDPVTWTELAARYPGARIVGCSTAGEIAGSRVLDDSLVATAITFEHGHVEAATLRLTEAPDAGALGRLLASRLSPVGLVHVIVLSDGLGVNGSALVAGLTSGLPSHVAVTGGLSGDGARFAQTTVCLDRPEPSSQVVAIGLYGERIQIGYGSLGGWDPFGPERQITRSEGNVLYELDGEPALALYKRYLGEHAASLPSSGLLFPLAIRATGGDDRPVFRTILSVDETLGTMTFAGDMPQGYRARLMRANVERLVDGASGAARASAGDGDQPVSLALLISCVGRKLVLKQRVEEEVEAVHNVLGTSTVLAGFYSYGEIAPFRRGAPCELHNQTMTITTVAER
jgi:hypothetical protein